MKQKQKSWSTAFATLLPKRPPGQWHDHSYRGWWSLPHLQALQTGLRVPLTWGCCFSILARCRTQAHAFCTQGSLAPPPAASWTCRLSGRRNCPAHGEKDKGPAVTPWQLLLPQWPKGLEDNTAQFSSPSS